MVKEGVGEGRREKGIGEGRHLPDVEVAATTSKGGKAMARLIQRIITPQGVEEFETYPNPQAWYQGMFPTCVRIEGELSAEALKYLVEKAAQFGWRYWPSERKFFPTDT